MHKMARGKNFGECSRVKRKAALPVTTNNKWSKFSTEFEQIENKQFLTLKLATGHPGEEGGDILSRIPRPEEDVTRSFLRESLGDLCLSALTVCLGGSSAIISPFGKLWRAARQMQILRVRVSQNIYVFSEILTARIDGLEGEGYVNGSCLWMQIC